VTIATKRLADLYVVASAVPFQLTTDVETKFEPVTVKFTGSPPAGSVLGLSDVTAGPAGATMSVAITGTPFAVAVMVTLLEDVTAEVDMANDAVVEPAATVIDGTRLATDVLLDDNATTRPPFGTAPVNVN
jgi:hypothetical protein